MIPRQLPHLAREQRRAVREQDLHLGDAAGVDEDLARRRVAGVVLVVHAKAPLAQRDPRRFAAPARVHEATPKRQQLADRRARLRCGLLLQTRLECEWARGYPERPHRGRTIPALVATLSTHVLDTATGR